MIYALGPFRLDTHDAVLFRGTEPVALGRRAVALLCALVERPGALVSKDVLIEAAWPGQAVEDSNLTVQIAAVRTEKSDSGVLVMKPANQGVRHDATNPLNRARDRRIFVQWAVCSRAVVIARVRFRTAQMLLA